MSDANLSECESWVPTLVDHAAGDLPEDAAHLLEAHLKGCAECAAGLKALREVPELLLADGAVPRLQSWGEFAARISHAIATTPRPLATRGFDLRVAMPIAAAAAIALAGWFAARPFLDPQAGLSEISAWERTDTESMIETAELLGVSLSSELLGRDGEPGAGGGVEALRRELGEAEIEALGALVGLEFDL